VRGFISATHAGIDILDFLFDALACVSCGLEMETKGSKHFDTLRFVVSVLDNHLDGRGY